MREIDLRPDELFDLSNDIFAKGSRITFKVHGRSMYPSVQDGDVLDIEAVEASDLKIGEVAFFRSSGNRPTVHRLIGRMMIDGAITLMMRGDAAPDADAPVRAEKVLGRVTRIQRGEKTIVLDHDHPWTLLLRIKLFFFGRIAVPLLMFCKRIAGSLLSGLQGTKSYRRLIRRLVGNKVLYRVACADDAPGLFKLYGHPKFSEPRNPVNAFKDYIENPAGRGRILVAEVMGGIAGAVIITECPWNPTLGPDLWLFSMLVRTRYRGAGIGEGLVIKAFEKSSEECSKGVSLLVSKHNIAAVNLYLKMGFKPSLVTYKDIEHKTGYIKQDFVLLSRSTEPLKNSSLR
jgi:signal peptidase I